MILNTHMTIPLLCHHLATRPRQTRVWAAAGVTMLPRTGTGRRDCILTYAASFAQDRVEAARVAGATEFAARGLVGRRVERHLGFPG